MSNIKPDQKYTDNSKLRNGYHTRLSEHLSKVHPSEADYISKHDINLLREMINEYKTSENKYTIFRTYEDDARIKAEAEEYKKRMARELEEYQRMEAEERRLKYEAEEKLKKKIHWCII